MTTLPKTFPERIIPHETEPGIVSIHLKRYQFALPYCERKHVLDVASGVGYGTAALSKVARSVIGVEIDPESLAYAKANYSSPNVRFEQMDATSLNLPESSFDTICSFETIEHLNNIEGYLSEMVRVLKSEGIYLVSTPHVRKTTHRPQNPFHLIEFSRRDFESLLRKHFAEVEIYGQRRKQSIPHYLLQKLDIFGLRSRLVPSFLVKQSAKALGTTPIADLSLDDIEIELEQLFMATEMLAVCKKPRKR